MDALEPAWRIPDGGGRDLGIGIVGCGGIVQYGHLPAYRDGGLQVRAVYDIDPERARTVASEFGIPVVASSAEELVATAGVDIVDIAVPPWVAAGHRHHRGGRGAPHAVPEAVRPGVRRRATDGGDGGGGGRPARGQPADALGRGHRGQPRPDRAGGRSVDPQRARSRSRSRRAGTSGRGSRRRPASRSCTTASTTSMPCAPCWATRNGSPACTAGTRSRTPSRARPRRSRCWTTRMGSRRWWP